MDGREIGWRAAHERLRGRNSKKVFRVKFSKKIGGHNLVEDEPKRAREKER